MDKHNFRALGVFIAVITIQTNHVIQACTYSSISSSLNTCTSVASGTSNTRWMFPYGSTAQQATFCQADVQANLTTCVQGVLWPCMSHAKVTKTFGTNGTNLITAYSKLCSNSLITDAHACMSTITPVSSYITAESSFISSVDALPDAATFVELCGLIVTLKYTAFEVLLRASCTTSEHLDVWSTFYDDIINSNVCTTCTGSYIIASAWTLILMTIISRLI